MKQILFTLLLINLLLVSKGQKAKIEYGFQSGLNISTAYGESISKDYSSSLTGLHIGGHLKIKKTENWGFKVVMAYDEIGWKYESLVFESNTGNGLVEGDVLFKLNYLNMPVLAEYSFGKKVRVFVDGGLFLGILLNNKIITQLKEPIPPNQDTESSSEYRKKTNYGLSLGAGVQIPIASKLKLDFDLRNNLGLANIYESHTSNDGNIKTNHFTISAGLSFEL